MEQRHKMTPEEIKARKHQLYLQRRKLKGRKKGKGKTKKPKSTRAQIHKRKILRATLRGQIKTERKQTSAALKAEFAKQRKALSDEIKAYNKDYRKQHKEDIHIQRLMLGAILAEKRRVTMKAIRDKYKAESKKINSVQ